MNKMCEDQMNSLIKKANELRNIILNMAIESGGHIASSFSCIDILVALYYGDILRIDPKKPEWEGRDRFILSKGHGEMALYSILADLDFFPFNRIETSYRKGDCYLGGHPDCKIPGIEVTTGSLGHGLGLAAGISIAAKMDDETHFQYVLMGDSECTEGSVWEAALFAGKHKLNNLIAIVDRNHLGVIDFTENFTNLEPFSDKWTAFGWDVTTVDGHNFKDILNAFQNIRMRNTNRPLLVIAETVKGKGISFMENDPIWHVLGLSNEKDINQAKQELIWDGA